MEAECGRKAVYYRKYEGRHLCRNHFLESIEKRVKRTVGQNNLIQSGDKIAFALSGGTDSSTALYIMNSVLGPRRDIEQLAITVNEGVEGYRDQTLKAAKKLCTDLGIDHHIFTFKEEFGQTLDEKVKEIRKKAKQEKRKTEIAEPCTYCGVARRYILNKKAKELGATKLALGLNLDDEVQSGLMNLIRGDLYRAARGGPITNYSIRKARTKNKKKLFVPRIKPLREIPEKESALYARLKGFTIHRGCPYAGGLRIEVRNFVNQLEKNHSGVKFTLLNSFDRLLPGFRKIAEEGEQDLTICKKCGEPSSGEICKACELWR